MGIGTLNSLGCQTTLEVMNSNNGAGNESKRRPKSNVNGEKKPKINA